MALIIRTTRQMQLSPGIVCGSREKDLLLRRRRVIFSEKATVLSHFCANKSGIVDQPASCYSAMRQ
jgi:hypothetical protein